MRFSLACAAAAVLAPCCLQAQNNCADDRDGAAADTTGEIVVTGEFRRTPLDKLPASVSVIDDEEIQARNARHLEDILALAPNVSIAGGASRSRFFQIRGIGERGQFNEPLNPSVGVLMDGVDLSAAATAAALLDIEQVEVFHGPQGTRYGANALAGLINIKTHSPTDTLEGRASMEAGNHDTWTLNGVLSGPLSETLGLRLAAQQHRSAGFLRNAYLSRNDTNSRDERTFRGKLRWRPRANATVDMLFGYVDIDNGYDAFSLDNNRVVLSDEPGRDAQETLFGSLALSWIGTAFGVEGTIGAAQSDSVYGYDEDWTYEGFHPFAYSSTDYYFRDRRNLTGEVRLLSQAPSRLFGGATDWTVGVYALDRREDLHRKYTFGSPFNSRFTERRAALFGQLQSTAGTRHTITIGMRFERHEATYVDSSALAFAPADNLFGWRLTLDRSLGNAAMAYGSISRGYKAGGFNTDGSLDADLRQYNPETLMNFELGLKGATWQHRLSARLAIFHMRRRNVQIASSLTRVRGDGSSEFIQYTGNAAEGTNTGVEAEMLLQPAPALEIAASLGVLRSKYLAFVNATGESLDGREQAHAPGYQFSIRGRYNITDDWYAELGAEGRDAFYFSDSHALRSRPYELLNAAVGLARGPWEVRLWGRNLAGQDYAVRGYFFGNDPRLGYADHGYTQLGAPRQFGITATFTLN